MATTLSCPMPVNTPAREPPRTQPNPLGLELRRPGEDLWAAILPNPSHPAMPYKVQYFASFGLAGHQVHFTPAAALTDALADGFTDPDPGALERLSQTPAWRERYDTPRAAPLSRAVDQVTRALARLDQEHATVETVTLRRGQVPPLIVVSTPILALTWRCYVWGHDRQGRYRRFTAHWRAARWCARSAMGRRARTFGGSGGSRYRLAESANPTFKPRAYRPGPGGGHWRGCLRTSDGFSLSPMVT